MSWHKLYREYHLCALSHALCPYVTGMDSKVTIIQTRTSGPLLPLLNLSEYIPQKKGEYGSGSAAVKTINNDSVEN